MKIKGQTNILCKPYESTSPFFPQLPVRMTHATTENVLKLSTATSVLASKASTEKSASKVRKKMMMMMTNDVALVLSLHYLKSLTGRT